MNEIKFDETRKPVELEYAQPPEPLRPRDAMEFTLNLLGGPMPVLLVLGIYLFMLGSRFGNWWGGAMIIIGAVVLQGLVITWGWRE